MYSVIGPDGKVYGPVDGATLKSWCQEGRINSESNIVDPIDGQEKRAGAIPEIAQYLPVAQPPMPPASPSPLGYGAAYPQNPVNNYNFSQPPTPYSYQGPVVYGPPKSKVVGMLLAFFLGALGIHRFYLGHNGTGLAMLLITVCTCGYGAVITGIWALVDMVLIGTGTLNDGYNRPLI